MHDVDLEVTDSTFEQLIGPTDGVVRVVFFWAPWCKLCEFLMPQVSQLVRQVSSGNALFLRADVRENREVADELQIPVLPCIVAFRDGKVRDHLTGAPPIELVQTWLEKQL